MDPSWDIDIISIYHISMENYNGYDISITNNIYIHHSCNLLIFLLISYNVHVSAWDANRRLGTRCRGTPDWQNDDPKPGGAAEHRHDMSPVVGS